MGLIGSLFAFPYVALFFVAWIASSLVRPLFWITVGCLLMNKQAAIDKLKLFLTTFQFLALSRDKKWEEPPYTPFPSQEDVQVERKTLIFVRHGESTWNDTFNRGDRSKANFLLYFIPNLIKAFVYEYYFFASGQANESWFFDSPLSEKGKSQALGLQKFLETDLEYSTPKEADLIRILLGETPSQLVSSNLRRAISTMVIGFLDRLVQKKDKIIILGELQEVSFNPDALSITPPQQKVHLAWTDPPYMESIYQEQIDTSMNTGNKSIDSNGLKRLQAFCKLVFEQIDNENIVAAGHSFWFRAFFREYLPKDFEHVAKKKKLINGGCVGFTLQRAKRKDSDDYVYGIDPASIVVLYGGF